MSCFPVHFWVDGRTVILLVRLHGSTPIAACRIPTYVGTYVVNTSSPPPCETTRKGHTNATINGKARDLFKISKSRAAQKSKTSSPGGTVVAVIVIVVIMLLLRGLLSSSDESCSHIYWPWAAGIIAVYMSVAFPARWYSRLIRLRIGKIGFAMTG